MAKKRVPISDEMVAAVSYAHNHTCCVCTEEGRPIAIHHLDGDPANNSFENLAVLCLDDHARAHTEGGFHRHLNSTTIAHYRQEWITRVARRRSAADEIAIAKAVLREMPTEDELSDAEWEMPSMAALFAYINHLPGALAAAYEAEQEEFDSGVTVRMIQGAARIADVLEQIWLHLAKWYPPSHFGKDAGQYISDLRSERARFHWAVSEVGGQDQGTMVRPMVMMSVVASLEDCVETTVMALIRFEETIDASDWSRRWNSVTSFQQEADGNYEPEQQRQPLLKFLRWFRYR